MAFNYEEMKLIIKSNKIKDEDKYIINISLEEKALKNSTNEERNILFKLMYEIDDKSEEDLNIFGRNFVENNNKKCKMIVNNKEKKIKENYFFKRKK